MDIQSVTSLSKIDPQQWDALVLDHHPLLSHAFLYGMEKYGCLTPESGWMPRYLIIEEQGELIAAMPLYEKTNSWGEFVFDHAWAEAYARNGVAYYPKLIAAIPFSPVFGQKFLFKTGREDELYPILLNGALQAADQLKCSSLHLLFTLEPEQAFLKSAGLIERRDCQYHWRNDEYASFDAFLARLSSRKRKNIRQERRRVQQAGITFRVLDGQTASAKDWQHFTEFYQLTYERKWGEPIFNQAFFEATARALGERMILVLADREDDCIAGALMYRGDNILYGRHWGCKEHHNALHFETCYYQGIEYCISHGIEVFEPGAQGPHKIARGFDPVLTHSAHWLADERFVPAVRQFCEDESGAVARYAQQAWSQRPYKKEGSN